MKKIITLVLVIGVAACGSQPTKNYSTLSDEQLSAQFQQALAEKPVPFCNTIRPLANEIYQRDESNREKLDTKLYSAIRCAIDEGRLHYTHELIQEYEETLGKSTGLLGFRVAYATSKSADAISRLSALSKSMDPKKFLSIEPEFFWDFFHSLASHKDYGLQRKVVEIMVQSPHFRKVQADVRSGLATRRLTFAIEEGDLIEVDRWISYISAPDMFPLLLSDRKFEAIWPNLEEAVGNNFKKITDTYLQENLEAYNANPANIVAYQAVADALVYSGLYEEAVEFIKTPSKEKMAHISKDAAWTLDRKVDALDALGRHDEADILFEDLATIPVTNESKKWLINFTINRAARLAGYGQWEQAYEAIKYAEKFGGSAYAKMIIRRVKICALANQGKSVTSLINELYDNRERSYINAAIGLMCGGNHKLAGEVLIEAWGNDSGKSKTLESIQEPLITFEPVRPHTPLLRDLLESNQELRALFESEARLIPERFKPLARLKDI